ncbi:hypothetical protein EJ02DRAFT_146651, partial [Clathrospora elynae]
LNGILREEANKHDVYAKLWQGQFDDKEKELRESTAAFEDRHQKQQDENLLYIKEYRSKTQDPGHCAVQDLQRKVAALEQDLKTTKKMLDITKTENSYLEDEKVRLFTDNSIFEDHIDKIEQTYAHNPGLPPRPQILSHEYGHDDGASAEPEESRRTSSSVLLSSR